MPESPWWLSLLGVRLGFGLPWLVWFLAAVIALLCFGFLKKESPLAETVEILHKGVAVRGGLVIEQDSVLLEPDKTSFDVLGGFSITNPGVVGIALSKLRFGFNGTNFNWHNNSWVPRGPTVGFLLSFERSPEALAGHDSLPVPPFPVSVQLKHFKKPIDCQLIVFHGTNRTESRFQIRPNEFARLAAQDGYAADYSKWSPPELPAGCTNVLLSLGGRTMDLPLIVARIGSSGTKFQIKDVPEEFLKGLEKATNYSPRSPYIWIRRARLGIEIGGKTIDYPIAPLVVSNRFFVQAQIPLTREKRVLLMRDALDSELPRLWDRNYDSNKFEVVNENRRPVLQVIYKAANEVQVNGIFLVDDFSVLESFGAEPLLIFPNVIVRNQQSTQQMTLKEFALTFTNLTLEMDTNAVYGIEFTDQKPIFKYPSNRYLGQLSN